MSRRLGRIIRCRRDWELGELGVGGSVGVASLLEQRDGGLPWPELWFASCGWFKHPFHAFGGKGYGIHAEGER